MPYGPNLAKTIILFVDLQEGLIDTSKTQSTKQLRSSVQLISQCALALQLPAIGSVVSFGAGKQPPLVPEITNFLPTIEARTRSGLSGFPVLESLFQDPSSVRDVIVAGIATEVGVLRTALDLVAYGHRAYVALDACGGLTERSEQGALQQMAAAGTIISSAPSLMSGFINDMTIEPGMSVLKALQNLVQ